MKPTFEKFEPHLVSPCFVIEKNFTPISHNHSLLLIPTTHLLIYLELVIKIRRNKKSHLNYFTSKKKAT